MQIHEVDTDMLAQVKLRDSTNLARMWYEYDPACLLNTSAMRPLALDRSTKVEHGRIFMLTASGFITSEAMGDLPVYMSPWPCMFIDDMPETADELGDSPIGNLGVVDIGSIAYPALLCRLAFVGMFFHDGFLQDAFAQWDFSRYPAGYCFADV
jgi:hypothetical protein